MEIIPKSIQNSLNHLAAVMHGQRFKLTCAIVIVGVGVCFALQFTMLSRIPEKMAFFIDSYSLATDKVTIGEESDICFKGVPTDYLTVTKTDGGFVWNVNSQYRDTLQYFKINNSNPNAIPIEDNGSQTISIEVPAMHRGGQPLTLSLTGENIWDEWEEHFDEQHDILLRHFAVHYNISHNNYSAKDTLGYMQQKMVRSFLEKKDGKMVLVILDELTSVNGQGYKRSDSIVGDACKVQFFSVADHCYADDKGDATFRIDGINYVMKPTVKLTEWGAGHTMIRKDGKMLSVHFPKGMGYVETVDTLKAMAHKTSDIMTIRQSGASYPTKSDIYLPQFSAQFSSDICSFDFKDGDVLLRKTRNDSILLDSKMHLVPTLTKTNLNMGNGTLKCRVGFINQTFALSYLWLPLAMALFLLFVVIGPFSSVRVPESLRNRIHGYSQLRSHPAFMAVLIIIALCFCVCKTMIALKLSYTFPYFEKITGVVPASTSLMLLLFVTVAMMLNTPLAKAVATKRKLSSPFITLVLLAAAYVFIVFAYFRILDPAVSESIIASYFPYEINISPKIWNWQDLFGINDNHRSVVYALIFVEGVALAAWAVALVLWKPLTKSFHSVCGTASGLAEKLNTCMAGKWYNLENAACVTMQKTIGKKIHIEPAQLACNDPNQKFSFKKWLGRAIGRLPLAGIILFAGLVLSIVACSWMPTLLAATVALVILASKTTYIAFVATIEMLFPWHVLLLALLAFGGGALGNFGTAFITMGVIIGLCNALSAVKFDNPNTPDIQEGLQPLEVLWQMLFISFAYIFCAMVADNGYMTNYIGFVIAFVAFFFLFKVPGWQNLLSGSIGKNTRKWIHVYLIFIVVFILALPYICSKIFDPKDVHYSRMARRMMLYSNFSNLQEAGYRYTETDAEFMVVMSHYMQHPDGGDPLSNDHHMMHASVSTGQSPVVLNDLSVPMAFFGSYGSNVGTILFFGLILMLLFLVMQYSLSFMGNRQTLLTRTMQWRILAVSLWTGTSMYLYLSYIGHLPFTGRLVPGFGVDAVGESLETAILLAFMAATTCNMINGPLPGKMEVEFEPIIIETKSKTKSTGKKDTDEPEATKTSKPETPKTSKPEAPKPEPSKHTFSFDDL